MIRYLPAAALLLLPAAAHADEDTQLWSLNAAQGRVGDVVVYAEVQPRFTDGPERLGQLLLRPAVGVQIGPRTTALVGYAYVRTEPLGGRATDEHRFWQQVAWPVVAAGRLAVTARTRLEQRTVVGADDLGWRLRQQLRATHPLAGKVAAVAWTEPFYTFNATDWGQRKGLDQVRTFAGVAVPVAPRLTAEPGYMNQTVFRRGEDRSNHVASLNLLYRW
jgi:hypothetical protein